MAVLEAIMESAHNDGRWMAVDRTPD